MPIEAHKRVGFGSVRYSVGQPMGFLSSWPAMALSHHVLVHTAFMRAYKRVDASGNLGVFNRSNLGMFDKYVILGDDIVI